MVLGGIIIFIGIITEETKWNFIKKRLKYKYKSEGDF